MGVPGAAAISANMLENGCTIIYHISMYLIVGVICTSIARLQQGHKTTQETIVSNPKVEELQYLQSSLIGQQATVLPLQFRSPSHRGKEKPLPPQHQI